MICVRQRRLYRESLPFFVNSYILLCENISLGGKIMSYVEEILEKVVAANPNEPEFHQAVKEVLESLKVVVDAN